MVLMNAWVESNCKTLHCCWNEELDVAVAAKVAMVEKYAGGRAIKAFDHQRLRSRKMP